MKYFAKSSVPAKELPRLFALISWVVALIYTLTYGYLGNHRAVFLIGGATACGFALWLASFWAKDATIRTGLTVVWTLVINAFPFCVGGFKSIGSAWVVAIPVVVLLLKDKASALWVMFISCLIVMLLGYLELYHSEINLNGFPFAPETTTFKLLNIAYLIGLIPIVTFFVLIFAEKERKAKRMVLDQKLMIEEQKSRLSEKNREIQSIMDNIKIGIFSISDPHTLTIDSEHSEHLKKILSDELVAGKSLDQLLLSKCEISADQRSMINTCLSTGIDNSHLSFDLNSGLLPQKLTIQSQNGPRSLELDWVASLDSKGDSVKKVLVTIRDVTELEEIKERVLKNESSIHIIMELIAVESRKFFIFQHSTQNCLTETIEILDPSARIDQDHTIHKVFIHFHTIKGAARTLGLNRMATCVHDAEDRLTRINSGTMGWRETILEDCHKIMELLNAYLEVSIKHLNRTEGPQDHVALSRNYVMQIADHAFGINASEPIPITSLISSVYTPAIEVIEESQQAIVRLAKDLGKDVPHVVHSGFDGIYFTSESYVVLNNTLLHIIRNSMDHGIESPDERRMRGKPIKSLITFSASMSAEFLTIGIADDGGGLAIDRIYHRAVEVGLIDDKPHSPQEIAQLIFKPGLSTAKEVTEISGRGAGMGAVRELMHKLGGNLDIQFTAPPHLGFVPFKFVLNIPSSHVRRLSSNTFCLRQSVISPAALAV